ncbi:phage tail protein [Lysinibacillus sp. FW12]|uniref:phage tail protein n=1 Tax=Lysinibacillus sp. FW12 TaxID=3096079 RepID=UPI003D75086B
MPLVKHKGIEYPINHIQSGRIDMEISNAHELNMVVVNRANNPAYPHLLEEAIVVVNDHEYRIKKLSNKTNYKNFSALHIVMDLAGTPFNQRLTGSYTPNEVFTELLAGTGWTFNFDATSVESSIELKDFGRSNVWKLLRDFCNRLQVEFGLLPGRVFDIRKTLSGDYGQQYRYAYNLRNLTKDSISTNLATHIIVNYGEDLQQTATFESPTASNYDRAIYGDIINDERIKTQEEAYERAKAKFQDIDISYELDIAQLGETHELGETIHTIYEPMDDLSIVTRILKVREEWNGEEFVATSVNVGNYVFKTAEEILQDQIKDTEDNVNENIDQTKEIIQREYRWELSETVTELEKNITTEYTAMVSLTARELRTEMTQHVTTINNDMGSMETRLSSSISQTAAQIRAEVSSEVTTINSGINTVKEDVSRLEITASGIQSTVTSHTSQIGGLNTQMSSAQSSITQLSNQITSKVSYTDYNGSTIISKINQDPYSVTIDAQKINMNGAVIVNGSITGYTDIRVNRDAYIGNNLILGANGDWGTKSVNFGSGSNITYNGSYLELSSLNVRLNGTNNEMNGYNTIFGTLNVPYSTNVTGLVRAESSGIGISYSNGNLIVKENGRTVGSVKLS